MLDILSLLVGRRVEARQVPDNVGSITATAETGKIVVNWSYAARADHYRLARQVNGGSWVLLDADVKGTTYEDATVESGKSYKYLVNAENNYGKSGNTASAAVTAL